MLHLERIKWFIMLLLFFFLVRPITYIIWKYEMNYPGGKRKFPFFEYTLICYICLDSGSKSVYILDILDMFATYSESVPLFFSFFQVNVFRCVWGRDIFTLTSLFYRLLILQNYSDVASPPFFNTFIWIYFLLFKALAALS